MHNQMVKQLDDQSIAPVAPVARQPRDPFRSLRALVRREGDVARYRAGTEEAYLVNHPDLVRHILADNSANYSKDTSLNANFKAAAADGILVSEGDAWRKRRRLMQPAFHRERIASFADTIVTTTLEVAAGWEAQLDTDQPIDLAEAMATVTMLITARVLFGVDVSDDADFVGRAISDFLPKLLNPGEDFRLARERVMRVVAGLVDERMANPTDGRDVLSMLLDARDDDGGALTREQIQEEALTLLLAGFETTANGLTWTWALLMEHPAAYERLATEVAATVGERTPSASDLTSLGYARMVFEESLRLYPPAWILGRRAMRDDTVGGVRIGAGSVVAISPFMLHRHPGFWDDAERFDPERFASSRAASRAPFSYLPFGGGPRLCIGHAMALVEAQLVIASLVQRHRFSLPAGHVVEPERLFILRPRGGLPAFVRRA
jgi:cytochrome P450